MRVAQHVVPVGASFRWACAQHVLEAPDLKERGDDEALLVGPQSFELRRCLLPASSYCEPKGEKPATWPIHGSTSHPRRRLRWRGRILLMRCELCSRGRSGRICCGRLKRARRLPRMAWPGPGFMEPGH